MSVPPKYTFTAELLPVPPMDATFIRIPLDVKREFGTEGQIKVFAEIDGFLYRGIIQRMEKEMPHIMVVVQAARKHTGKKAGDTVSVVLWRDTESRVPEIPDFLTSWLAQHKSEKSFFEALSNSNKKEYIRYLTEAKRPETREKRWAQVQQNLKEKKPTPFVKK